MEQVAKKQGKKNRKFGRCNRSPSGKRYVAESRWDVNKKKRVARNAMRMAKAAAKIAAGITPHGTARALRRSVTVVTD